MPRYQITAPNGKTYQIDGPDGATDDQVRQQVMTQYPEAGATEKSPVLPPVAAPTPAPAPTDGGLTVDVTGGRYPNKGESGYDEFIKAGYPTDAQGNIIDKTQGSSRIAPVPVKTRQQEIQEIARQQVEAGNTPDSLGGENGMVGSVWNAMRAAGSGVNDWLPFDIANRGEALLQQATGRGAGKDYADQLEIQREISRQLGEKNYMARITGDVGGALGGGTVLAKGIQKGAGLLADAASPAVAGVGNFLQKLTTLNRGEKAANVGKLALGGAAYGGTDAALEGKDATGIAEQAGAGAVMAPLGAKAIDVAGKAGAKLIGAVSRLVADFLKLDTAGDILKKYTTMTADQLRAALAAKRAQGVPNPTVFEVLPLGDRENIRKAVGMMPAAARDTQAALVRQRAGNVGPEMQAAASDAVGGDQNMRVADIAQRLAMSRGSANPLPQEIDLAHAASTSPTAMDRVRSQRAQNIMAAHDPVPVAGSVNELLPQQPVNNNGTITQEITDPDIANAIRKVAGSATARNGPITVSDVSDMIKKLRAIQRKGGIEGATAEGAINHLTDELAARNPAAAAAHNHMTGAYASDSRILEGMQEGARTRTEPEIMDPDITSRQAYSTIEGATGRAFGQAGKLAKDFGGTPEQAVSSAQEIATSPNKQRAISGNLGNDAGGQIAGAADAQADSMRALSAVRGVQPDAEPVDLPHMVRALTALNPAAAAHTKLWALGHMAKFFNKLPARQSQQIVDALFSQNPAAITRAAGLLNNAGADGQRALSVLAHGIVGAEVSKPVSELMKSDTPPPPAPEVDPTAFDPLDPADAPAAPGTEKPGSVPYGHQVISDLFPDAHVTEDRRDPNSPLGRANPNSDHIKNGNTVDVRPIPGMTFREFIDRIHKAGHEIVQARDEVKSPVPWATGPHWHVEIAGPN